MADLTGVEWDQWPLGTQPVDRASPNFQLYELTASEKADRLNIDNSFLGTHHVRSLMWRFFCFLFITTSWSLTMADTHTEKEVRFDSVEVLSKVKSQVESRVKFIQSLLEDGDIVEKDLRKVKILYDGARADVNSGLDRLLVELESTGSQGETEPYNRIAERAATQTAEFLKVSNEIILGDNRGPVEAGVDFVNTLVNAFVDVWKTLRSEKSDRHAKLVQRIESLKWDEFSEIK